MHRHEHASLCLVVDGAYAQRTHGREERHAIGHLMFCPADAPHAQTFARSGALKIHVSPGPELHDVLGMRVALQDAPFACADTLVAIARRIATELLRPDDCSPLAVEGLVLEAVDRFGRAEKADTRAAWLARAREYVESRAFEAFTLADVAHAVGRHPIHVAREFKRAYACTVGEHVRGVRVRTAMALLRSGRLSVAEIAGECGFYDQAHLTRAFRAVHGMTPGAYRSARSSTDASPVQSLRRRRGQTRS
jgi:AraC family transcriptional regulator